MHERTQRGLDPKTTSTQVHPSIAHALRNLSPPLAIRTSGS